MNLDNNGRLTQKVDAGEGGRLSGLSSRLKGNLTIQEGLSREERSACLGSGGWIRRERPLRAFVPCRGKLKRGRRKKGTSRCSEDIVPAK